MSTPQPTSIKTPAKLKPILGEYAPIKSTITKTRLVAGKRSLCFQLDISQLTEKQLRDLANHESRSPEEIKKRGYCLPALKNSSVFGVPD